MLWIGCPLMLLRDCLWVASLDDGWVGVVLWEGVNDDQTIGTQMDPHVDTTKHFVF